MRILTSWSYWCCLAILCLAAFPAWAAPPYTINYTLSAAGRVSMNIYDTGGHVVRELMKATQQNAGSNNVVWDGRDNNGNLVSGSDNCTWKLLRTPSGLHAEFLIGIMNSLPYGSVSGSWGTSPQWSSGLGNHIGVRSVAVSGSTIFLAAGSAENVRSFLKMPADGSSVTCDYPQPSVSMGYFSRAVMDSKVFGLEQNCWISGAGVNEQGGKYSSVGYCPGGDYYGWRFDVLWPGDTRPGMADYSFAEMPMDLAAYNSGSNPQLVVSYQNHNAVRYYNPSFTVTNGIANTSVLYTVSVTAPKGVAIANNGDVLIISGTSVLKSVNHGTPTTLITGLTAPYRLDVNRANGDILVAERGSSHQVKRFNSAGVLQQTYGRNGGRQFGVYVATDFSNLNDIASDNNGGFWITEADGLSRTAHIAQSGTLVKEFYTGSIWTPFASPQPDDPSVVWCQLPGGTIARVLVNYTNKTWTLHSIYNFDTTANNLLVTNTMGAGIGVWRARVHNGTHYLVYEISNQFQVVRVDEANGRLVPCYIAWAGRPDLYQYGFEWTDQNGDGLVQAATEKVSYTSWGDIALNIRSDVNMNYWYLSPSTNPFSVIRVPVTGWTAYGPTYRTLQNSFNAPFAPHPFPNIKDNQNNNFAFGTDGSLFCNYNIGDHGWGSIDDAHMVKYDNAGNLLWQAGKVGANHDYLDYDIFGSHPIVPGEIWSSFRNCAGVANGCVIATDMQGGNNDREYWSAFTYVWDQDGLWVGGAFEIANCNTSVYPITYYCHSSENGSGEVYTDPGTGDVYYYAGAENDVRIYKITGWSGWERQNGNMSGSSQVTTPTYNPAAGSYGSAQTVTISTTTSGATIRYSTDGTTPSSTVGTVYSTPVNISSSCTLKAIAYKSGMTDSTVTLGVYTISLTQCATPTYNPAAGSYGSAQSVTISTTTTGATIRYTTDGTTPSSTVGTVYSTPVNISTSCTLKAIAYKNGMTDSTVASGVYTISGGGTLTNFFTASYTGSRHDMTGTVGYEFTPSQNITVTALGRSVSGTMTQNHLIAIWQVSNQSLITSATVTPASPTDALGYKYITLGTSATLTSGTTYRIVSDENLNGDNWMDQASITSHTAIATVTASVYGSTQGTYPGFVNQSGQVGFVPPTFYTGGDTQCAAPTYNPVAGTYSSAQTVTISTTTSGATIRYTTDGTTPSSTVGTVYSTPVNISSSCTLKAIAYKSGMTDSTVTSGVYTISSDVTTNLYARWNFNSNATDTAPNGTANNGTLYGGPTYNTTDYKVGTAAMSFVASSIQQVRIADHADLKPSDRITICFWMKPTASAGASANLLCKSDSALSTLPYRLRYASGSLRFDLKLGGTDRYVTTSQPAAGTWVHVAATYDGSTMKLYTNGGTPATASYSGSIETAAVSDISIGCRLDRNSAVDAFDGLIDDVRIYKGYALTQAEIQQVMAIF